MRVCVRQWRHGSRACPVIPDMLCGQEGLERSHKRRIMRQLDWAELWHAIWRSDCGSCLTSKWLHWTSDHKQSDLCGWHALHGNWDEHVYVMTRIRVQLLLRTHTRHTNTRIHAHSQICIHTSRALVTKYREGEL